VRKAAALLALLALTGCGLFRSTPEGPPPNNLTIEVVASPGAPLSAASIKCYFGGAVEGTGFLADRARARAACLFLRGPGVERRLIPPSPSPRACTQVYGGPQRATVRGIVGGDLAANTEFSRADGCGIADWQRFEPLLGPPPNP
jgi:hypothetical protein